MFENVEECPYCQGEIDESGSCCNCGFEPRKECNWLWVMEELHDAQAMLARERVCPECGNGTWIECAHHGRVDDWEKEAVKRE